MSATIKKVFKRKLRHFDPIAVVAARFLILVRTIDIYSIPYRRHAGFDGEYVDIRSGRAQHGVRLSTARRLRHRPAPVAAAAPP